MTRSPSTPTNLPTGHVSFVGAGPGDPDLLTLKAIRALEAGDVVIHDSLVSRGVLKIAGRSSVLIDMGKRGFARSTPQSAINTLITDHARAGAHVIRLKSGDPTLFGRLDEEIDACDAAGLSWSVVPGLTAASAAVA